MTTQKWARSMRDRVRRERVEQLVKWATEHGIEDLQHIYEKARLEFPAASEENARNIAKAALKNLKVVIPNEAVKGHKIKRK